MYRTGRGSKGGQSAKLLVLVEIALLVDEERVVWRLRRLIVGRIGYTRLEIGQPWPYASNRHVLIVSKGHFLVSLLFHSADEHLGQAFLGLFTSSEQAWRVLGRCLELVEKFRVEKSEQEIQETRSL